MCDPFMKCFAKQVSLVVALCKDGESSNMIYHAFSFRATFSTDCLLHFNSKKKTLWAYLVKL